MPKKQNDTPKWEDVPAEPQADWQKFEVVGDSITGVLQGIFSFTSMNQQRQGLRILTLEGETIPVGVTAHLQGFLNHLVVGKLIRIEFTGMKGRMKLYSVRQSPLTAEYREILDSMEDPTF